MASCDRSALLIAMALVSACTGTMSSSERDAGTADDAARAHDAAGASDGSLPMDDAQATADAGPVRGASCPAGAILCESFEEGTAIDTARWTVNADDGVFVLDAAHAADGARSLHMRYGQPYGALGEQAIVT